jgi:CRISPR/Cas system-associated protein Csm6
MEPEVRSHLIRKLEKAGRRQRPITVGDFVTALDLYAQRNYVRSEMQVYTLSDENIRELGRTYCAKPPDLPLAIKQEPHGEKRKAE